MIELLPGSLAHQTMAQGSLPPETALGELTLTGEIVDSKCYLGVMNPGHTKVHRDCAARCISGGIPPILVTSGDAYLLTGRDGRKLNQEVRDLVGETIQVQGAVVQDGETATLRAEPEAFRRVVSLSDSSK
jgi:hypothetical protein